MFLGAHLCEARQVNHGETEDGVREELDRDWLRADALVAPRHPVRLPLYLHAHLIPVCIYLRIRRQ
jgi:hypothetical protein